jgi:hypothetical protein
MNTLREALQEYLELRRGLGYKMRDAGLLLPKFISFLEQRRAEYISARLALEWAQRPSVQPAEWARRLCFVRGFARHRSATDSRTEVPPIGLLPHRPSLSGRPPSTAAMWRADGLVVPAISSRPHIDPQSGH